MLTLADSRERSVLKAGESAFRRSG